MEKKHRDILQRLWVKLLENISDYQRITDRLFAEDILTLRLKERVEQKQGSDQLREIMDILPKRGPRAFETFCQVLDDCGENRAADLLHLDLPSLLEDDELPTKWPDYDHDSSQLVVTKVPDGHRWMKKKFDKAVTGKGTVHAMHNPCRGIFLLIDNEKFQAAQAQLNIPAKERQKDREGTKKDARALTDLFTQLHFRVVIEEDLSAEKILEAVQTQVNKVEATDNCFACAVLSHGDHGVVYGVDGEKVALEDLKTAVADCQKLVGKPKIFFIQACQGEKGVPVASGKGDAAPSPKEKSEDVDLQVVADKLANNIAETTQSDAKQVFPKSEIFVAMATVPDFVSWRHPDWGSWFVQTVAYIFSRFAHKYDINQLMTRVNSLVVRAETKRGCKQVAVYSSSLTSDFYFFPGLLHSVGH